MSVSDGMAGLEDISGGQESGSTQDPWKYLFHVLPPETRALATGLSGPAYDLNGSLT